MNHNPSDQGTSDVTEDRVLGGRVLLRQPARGYRAGLDAALLAAACDAPDGARVLEAGSGVGGALLQAAARRPKTHFVGVERDPAACRLAGLNAARAAGSSRSNCIRHSACGPAQ